MYRQMSGRAGRRGYDDVGNVIFFGVRAERAAQLMTTKLPSLQGQFPLSATLGLRTLLLQQRLERPQALSGTSIIATANCEYFQSSRMFHPINQNNILGQNIVHYTRIEI